MTTIFVVSLDGRILGAIDADIEFGGTSDGLVDFEIIDPGKYLELKAAAVRRMVQPEQTIEGRP